MKFSILSVVSGTDICNARCPFCVSRMTPKRTVGKRPTEIDWRNFHKAAQLAREGGAQTVMITGKGEPTLYPEQVSEYLKELQRHSFPFVELQTNATLFDLKRERYEPLLRQWYDLGLTTVSISVVHYAADRNREIYLPHLPQYIDLQRVIQLLHEIGFTVRLSVVMVAGFIDSVTELARFIEVARDWQVEQLSFRAVTAPGRSEDPEAFRWTVEHMVPQRTVGEMLHYLDSKGSRLQTLPHGAAIFDVDGQNVCLTNCLTIQPEAQQVRQLIFFPTGTVAYDWQYEGAILLRGRYDAHKAQAMAA